METMNYWISARIADGDTFEMVSIRAVAASISYEQTSAWSASTYLFELPTTRIGRDPTHEATETIKLLSGHGLIEDLPAEVRALLSDKRTELQSNRPAIEWYPPGAKTLYLKLLGVEDALPGETYELVHLYLLKLAEVQANLNLRMDGNESLRWIVDHWDLGDVGCAQALDPSHRRQATRRRATPTPNSDASTRTSRAFDKRHTVPHVDQVTASDPTPPIRERSPEPRSPEPTKAAQQAPTPLPLSAQTPPGTPAQPDSAPETIQTNMSIEEEPEVVQPNVSTTRHESAAMDDLRAAVAKLRGSLL